MTARPEVCLQTAGTLSAHLFGHSKQALLFLFGRFESPEQPRMALDKAHSQNNGVFSVISMS
jgi:hypothetical protein